MSAARFLADPGGPEKTLAYWHEVMRDVFRSPWELSPTAPSSFSMIMDVAEIEDLRLSRATLGRAKIVNAPEPSRRRADPVYYLQVASSGQHVVWDGGESVLRPGDIVLLNSAMRCQSLTEGDYTTVALTIPGDILRAHLPDPRQAVGRTLYRTDRLSFAASQLLLSLWEMSDNDVLGEVGAKLSHNLMEIFAAAWHANNLEQQRTPASRRLRLAQVRGYVDQHLRDPDLSVTSIAAALGVTTRYLQVIFQEQGEPLSCYIRRKRLDGCRSELMDPLWRDRSVTTTAYDWGFNSMAHFGRLFREAFGVTPGSLRQRAAGSWRRGAAMRTYRPPPAQ